MSAASSSHVNPTPVPEVGAIPAEGSGRQRGPVEEVIAKRMKQIGKKLQRYRTYISADPSTLNADQKAALISLPALEGAYKELEDLVREKGPVEEQELIQAAKLREATEAAKAAALAEAGASTEQFKTSLVQPLSLFLRLYALLHPARPSDHEHLTFSALTLPSNLQDEVQATDVLRVGRIYEDLTLGGDAAVAALELLAQGPTGEDEENDRVHHLLELLSRPEESVPEPTEETSAETTEDYTAAALATSAEEAMEAAPQGAVVPEKENDLLPNGHSHSHPVAHQPATINFLQDDELDTKADVQEEKAVEEPTEAVTPAEVITPAEVQTPGSGKATRDFAPASTSNWADLDDEEAQPEQAAPQPAASADASAQPAEKAVLTEGDANASSAGAPAAQNKDGKSSRGRGSRKPSSRGRGGAARQPQSAQPQSQGEKKVDDDGFEVKQRRTGPQAPQTPGRGRGGGRGGAGRGRGRGGANGNTGAAEGNSRGKGEGRPNAPRQPSQKQEAPKPKASIYKAVQPTGPTSAPIL